MKNLKTYLQADKDRVMALMESSLRSDIDLLMRCNRHILEHEGKQVRPDVAILIARAVAGDVTEDTIRFSAAAELIHNASLLHDDVADSSSTRRGVATVSSLLGPRPSVLLGDFWLVKGIARILEGDKNASRVMGLFSKTLSDLAEGEMLQLEMAESGKTTEKEYYRIIYDKTATLFETSALAGAISVGATPEQEAAASEYARCVGIAFQIQDDILDYFGNEAMGKPVGQDLKEKKITLPLLGAFKADAAQEQKIREMISNIGPESIDYIRNFVLEKDGVGYAKAEMEAYLSKAVKALDVFQDGKPKEYLIKLAAYIGNRNK